MTCSSWTRSSRSMRARSRRGSRLQARAALLRVPPPDRVHRLPRRAVRDPTFSMLGAFAVNIARKPADDVSGALRQPPRVRPAEPSRRRQAPSGRVGEPAHPHTQVLAWVRDSGQGLGSPAWAIWTPSSAFSVARPRATSSGLPAPSLDQRLVRARPLDGDPGDLGEAVPSLPDPASEGAAAARLWMAITPEASPRGERIGRATQPEKPAFAMSEPACSRPARFGRRARENGGRACAHRSAARASAVAPSSRAAPSSAGLGTSPATEAI